MGVPALARRARLVGLDVQTVRVPTYSRSVTVRLTARQHSALREYAKAIDVPVAVVVRGQVAAAIPPRFWDREEVPPGQMTIAEATS